jgi:hypothetical protein
LTFDLPAFEGLVAYPGRFLAPRSTVDYFQGRVRRTDRRVGGHGPPFGGTYSVGAKNGFCIYSVVTREVAAGVAFKLTGDRNGRKNRTFQKL